MWTNCSQSYHFTPERLKVRHTLNKDERTADDKTFNLIFRHKIKVIQNAKGTQKSLKKKSNEKCKEAAVDWLIFGV